MRWRRFPPVAVAALLLGLVCAGPAVAQPDHLHLDLSLVGCGELKATAYELPESAKLDLRFLNAAHDKVLAEQGKVQLDSPLVNYAPGLKLPAAAEYRATVSDLLSHRLGLPKHSFDNKLEEGDSVPMLKAQLATAGIGCAPHSCWSYQNVAYDGASDIVAKATGKTYQDTVRDQLFGPIGMTSATMTRDGLMTAASWARPHSIGRRPLEVTEPYYDVPSAGGVTATPPR